MRHKITLCLLLISMTVLSQAPQQINYQGAARRADGTAITNRTIGIRFDLHQGGAGSPVVFTESQTVSTGAHGVFSTQIGKINTTGLNTLNWEGNSFFLEVSVDTAGGTNYISMGVQQLVSVPFALQANSVPSTYSNNVLTIGSKTYTLSSAAALPNTSLTTTGGGATVTSSGTNTFNIDVPVTTFSAGPNISIQGTHPNYTIAAIGAAGTTSLVSTGAANTATLGANSFSIDVPVPTFSNSGQNIITGSYPNFTVNTPTVATAPTPSLSITGNSLSVIGSNTVILPAGGAPTFTGTGAAQISTLSANSFSVHVPQVSLTQSTGIAVTGAYPNYTVASTAASPNFTGTGAAQISTLSANNFSVHVPQVSLTQSAGIAVTGAYPNYTVASTAASPNFTGTGAAQISTLSANNFSVHVPQVSLTQSTGITVTGTYPNYTVSSTAAAPNFTGTGAVQITTLSAGNFSVHVDAPVLSLNGSSLSVNGSNTVTLPGPTFAGTGAAQITTLSANNFSVHVPQVSLTQSTGITVTGTYPNYTVSSTAASPNFTGTGAAQITTLSANNFSVHVDPPSFTSTGAAQVTTLSANNFSVHVPQVSLTQSTGIAVTGAYPNYTVSSTAAAPNFAGTGAVQITTVSPNNFNVDVAPVGVAVTSTATTLSVTATGNNSVSINIPTVSIVPGTSGNITISGSYPNYTVDSAPTLTLVGNQLSIVNGGGAPVTLGGVPVTTSVQSSGIATTYTLAPDNYSIHVPAPAFSNNGPVTLTGSYPNYTINSSAAPSYSAGTGIGITSGTVINTAPDQPVSITDGGNVTVTGAYPNFTLAAPAATSYSAGTGIGVVSGSIINTSPDQAVSITDGGNVTVTGAYPNFTLAAPAATSYSAGAGISVVSGSIINAAPDQAVSITDGGNVTVTGAYPNFTLAAPAATSYSAGAGISVVSGSIINTSPDQAVSISDGGNVTVTGAYPNFTLAAPAPQPVSISNGGNITVTGAYPNFTLAAPAATSYSAGTGISVTSGSIINTAPDQAVSISNGGNVTVTGAYPNFTLAAPAATPVSITDGGNVTVTGAYPNFTLAAPAATSYSAGTGISVLSGSIINTAPDQAVNLSGQGNVSIIGVYPNYTVSAPAYANGTGISIASGSITNTAPDQAVSISNGGNVTVTGAYPNFTLAAPAATSYSAGTGISVLSGSIINTAPDQGVSISNGGNVTVTGAYPNFTLAAPAPVSTSIYPSGSATVTGVSPSFTIATPPSPTITGTGLAVVSPSTGANITVNVPLLSYTPATGVLGAGSNTLNITQALTLSGTTLSAGAPSNSVNLSGLTPFTTIGNSVVQTTLTDFVGIGTSAPLAKLDVVESNTYTGTHLRVQNSNGSNTTDMVDLSTNGTGYAVNISNTNAGASVNAAMISGGLQLRGKTSNSSGYALRAIDLSSSDLFAVRNDGNVGIGIPNPSSKLYVFNSTSSTQGMIVDVTNSTNSSIGAQFRHFGTGNATYIDVSNTNSPGHAIYATSNSDIQYTTRSINTSAVLSTYAGIFEGGLVAKGKNSAATAYSFKAQNASNTDLFVIRNDGHVGIQATNPLAMLTVSNTTASDETSYFNVDNSSATGHALVAMSNSNNQYAMRVLNTSSTLNAYAAMIEGGLIARGKNNANTAFAFKAQETGGGDLFVVRNDGNVGIRNGTPNYDLSIFNPGTFSSLQMRNGASAGLGFVIGQNNTNVSLLNYESTPMYIGTSGANRVIVTATGSVGIGSGAMSPGAKLDVDGNVKITDGSQGNGKVLTSDANGLASWQALFPVPSGAVIAFAGPTIPSGWLVCDGSAVSRTTYATLFAAIGTAWGVGDGSTTFNLPDMRGMFLRGVNQSAPAAAGDPDNASRVATNGGNAGNNVGSKQVDELGAHNHSISNFGSQTSVLLSGLGAAMYDPTVSTKNTNNAGGAETRPKNVYVYYMIKQ